MLELKEQLAEYGDFLDRCDDTVRSSFTDSQATSGYASRRRRRARVAVASAVAMLAVVVAAVVLMSSSREPSRIKAPPAQQSTDGTPPSGTPSAAERVNTCLEQQAFLATQPGHAASPAGTIALLDHGTDQTVFMPVDEYCKSVVALTPLQGSVQIVLLNGVLRSYGAQITPTSTTTP